jgi:hypothetical protein
MVGARDQRTADFEPLVIILATQIAGTEYSKCAKAATAHLRL